MRRKNHKQQRTSMKSKTKISKKYSDDLQSSPSSQIVASNDDLLTEILRRVPIKSLLRFELVSKHWQSIITSCQFILLRHGNPSPAVGLFLCPSSGEFDPNPLYAYVSFSVKEPTNPPFRRLDFTTNQKHPLAEIWHSCNGLFICSNSWDESWDNDHIRRFYVFNPSTKKYFALSRFQALGNKVSIRIHGIQLAFDPTKSPHYKVVVVWTAEAEERGPSDNQFQVYSSETGCWRMCYKPFKGIFSFYDGVYWNGAINWCSFLTDEYLYFNVADEVFEKMPRPPIPDGWDIRKLESRKKLYFGESCDHLHYVGIFGPQIQFNVYELKRDYSEWFVKYQVDLLAVVAANPEMTWDHYLTPAGYYNYKIFTLVRGEKEEDSFLILEIPEKAIRFNIVENTFETVCELRHDEDEDFLTLGMFGALKGFQYIESLRSV